jgi:hypothetical protein
MRKSVTGSEKAVVAALLWEGRMTNYNKGPVLTFNASYSPYPSALDQTYSALCCEWLDLKT